MKIALVIVALGLWGTAALAQDAVQLDTTVVERDMFHVWPNRAVRATVPTVTVKLGRVHTDDVIAEVPFDFLYKVRLTAPIKGEMLGIEFLPAGEVGFQYTPGASDIFCFFSKKDPRLTYSHPTCYGRHPLRKERVAEVGVESNVPLAYTYKGSGSSVLHMPVFEPVDIRFDHDFKFVLTHARWSTKLLRIDWQSDGRTVQTLQLVRAADGSTSLKTSTGSLRFTQDPADKKATIIDYVPNAGKATAARIEP